MKNFQDPKLSGCGWALVGRVVFFCVLSAFLPGHLMSVCFFFCTVINLFLFTTRNRRRGVDRMNVSTFKKISMNQPVTFIFNSLTIVWVLNQEQRTILWLPEYRRYGNYKSKFKIPFFNNEQRSLFPLLKTYFFNELFNHS